MALGFGFGGSKESGSSKSSTNPWAKQAPFLEWAFQNAQQLAGSGPYGGAYWTDPNQMMLSANQAGYDASLGGVGALGDMYGQYSAMLAPQLGMASQYATDVMSGVRGGYTNPYGSDQYNQMLSDYWSPAYQAADEANLNAGIEALRRSDFQDALGASLAGQGVGGTSSEYLQARNLQAENMMDQYQQMNAQLQQSALGAAQQRANQWAGTDFQSQQLQNAYQQQAAGMANQMGMAGIGLGQQGYDATQAAYGDQLGYGMNQFGWDEMARQGQYDQWMDRWAPLMNYWSIIGAGNWGQETNSSYSKKGSSWSLGGKT